jgi:sugar phosphate isomerase/epimerase
MAHVFPAQVVGVIIDVYHVWWDPNIYRQIERARGRILGFHVNDWQVPVGDPLRSRRVMGDGVIELRRMRRAVDDAGYSGPIEVEVFNNELASRPAAQVIDLVATRYIEHVAEGGTRGD